MIYTSYELIWVELIWYISTQTELKSEITMNQFFTAVFTQPRDPPDLEVLFNDCWEVTVAGKT